MATSSKALRWVTFWLRVALGVIFVYAAWVKLRLPWELFAMSIDSYQLLPTSMVEVLARTLLVTAMAFLRPRRSPLLEPASLQPRSTPPEPAPNLPPSESQSRL